MNNITEFAPRWLLRPRAAFATIDPNLNSRVMALCDQLPEKLYELDKLLEKHSSKSYYDAAANIANAAVWAKLNSILDREDLKVVCSNYFRNHFPHDGLSRVIRRMIIRPSLKSYGCRLLKDTQLSEVSIATYSYGLGNSRHWNRSRTGNRRPGSSARRRMQGVPDIATVGQLRELLKIRSSSQLGFLLSAVADDKGPYKQFEIPKRSGEPRVIHAPCTSLLWVQRRILRNILEPLQVHECSHGFVKGRSTVSNAALHVGAPLVLKFDLRDFFPTIGEYRVMGLFASMGYHIGKGRYSTDDRSHDVGPVLARLCCMTSERGKPGVLPQGAPTSPAITNLICRRLDQRLLGIAAKFGGTYSRYADDLTFSFHDQSFNVGRFRWWIEQVCFQEGFMVRQDKFRAIRASQQQRVTGIVVNERMNVSREQRRKVRAMLHQCRRDGVKEVQKREPGIAGYLRGFAAYVNMVDPLDQGKLMREVAEVLSKESLQ